MSFQQPVTADSSHGIAFAGGIAEGALVRTPCGPRRIETLRAGDMVVTRCEGLKPLRMVLRRHVSREEFLKAPERAPIRIAPRAVGPMMPQQPLLLAADHKVLVPGYRVEDQPDDAPVLALARDLLNAAEDTRVDKSSNGVTFVQLVFDAHVVFTANGLPVESFAGTRPALEGIPEEVKQRLEAAIPGLRKADLPNPAARFATVESIAFLPAAF